MDIFAPIKVIQVKSTYAPWLSESTKQVMKRRDYAQQVAVFTKDQGHIGSSIETVLRKDRKLWESNQLDSLKSSPADLWRNLKGWMGWKNSAPPTKLFHKEKLMSSPQELADSMNCFFLEKVQSLQENLPPAKNDPLEALRMAMSERTCNFNFRTVHPDEVLEIVKALKNCKSAGLDDIDTLSLNFIIEEILPALTHVINLSLKNLYFPSQWKLAKVIRRTTDQLLYFRF